MREKQINRTILKDLQKEPEQLSLGPAYVRTDIPSSLGPFIAHPHHRVKYPDRVISALGHLYQDYNRAFRPLIDKNQEWETDYQYARNSHGDPVNSFVQIDMNGLPNHFLRLCEQLTTEELTDALRNNIFEYENSLAMYGLLQRIFGYPDRISKFRVGFRHGLDAIRAKHDKKIALLAVTDQKYNAMITSEFGKEEGDSISDNEVKQISGFDRFFGPRDFLEYIRSNGGNSDYIIYARTSEPVSKLKDPSLQVDTPLLEDPEIRRIIKANAITFNIDNPEWDSKDDRKINDTKAWMPTLEMAYHIDCVASLYSNDFRDHLLDQGINLEDIAAGNISQAHRRALGEIFTRFPSNLLLSNSFIDHLITRDIDPHLVATGQLDLRFKPEIASYGAYGHERGPINRLKTFNAVAAEVNLRGSYVVQPEMVVPTIVNEDESKSYIFIDRNFMNTLDNEEHHFIGGFRSLMPSDSIEAKKGRVHGNSNTRWVEIY